MDCPMSKPFDSSIESVGKAPGESPPGSVDSPPEAATMIVTRRSIYERGAAEAMTHKWIVSEKANRDLGPTAIREWIGTHWNTFLRWRWLEHLEGRYFWIELDPNDFGLLNRELRDEPLFAPVFEMIKQGRENLDVILWALQRDQPMDQMHRILEVIDVNKRRIECRLEAILSGQEPRC